MSLRMLSENIFSQNFCPPNICDPNFCPPNICDPSFCPPNIYDKSTPVGGSNHFLIVLNLDILRLCSIQSVHVRIFLASTKVVCPFSDTPSLQICSILLHNRVL